MILKQIRPDCATLLGREISHKDEKKSLSFCRDLLSNIISQDFTNWFDCEISRLSGVPIPNLFDDGEEPGMPDEEFTEKSFCDTPKSEMKKMWSIWKDLTPYQASNPAVWTYINLKMIKLDLIKPWFFVNPKQGNKKNITGKALAEKSLRKEKMLREKIDGIKNESKNLKKEIKELKEDLLKSEKEIREYARSVSRFLTGYVPERSIRPLYSNCPPARAWWMWHLAEKAAKAEIFPYADADYIFGVLREKWVWAELTEKTVSRLTVVGDINIRHGIIRFFLLPKEQGAPKWMRSSKPFRSLLLGIGEMSAWRALGFFEPDRISDILRDEITPNITDDSSEQDNDILDEADNEDEYQG